LAVLAFFPAMLGSIFCLAVPQAITYFVARERQAAARYFSAGLLCAALLGVVGAGLAAFLAPRFLLPENAHLAGQVALVCLLGWPMVVVPSLIGVAQGVNAFGAVNTYLLANATLYLLTLFTLFSIDCLTPLSAELAALACVLVAGGWLGARTLTLVGTLAWPERGLVAQIASKAVLFFLPVMALILLGQADRATLIRMGAVADLGYYAVAFSTAYPLALAGEAISQVSFVHVAAAASRADALELLTRLFRVERTLLSAGAVLYAIGAPVLVVLVYGQHFRPAVAPTSVLVAALALRGLARPLENGLRALGKPWWGALVGLAAIVAFAASVWILPIGPPALLVSVALLVGQSVYLTFLLAAMRWSFGVPLAHFVGKWGESANDAAGQVRTMASWLRCRVRS
jgi:O-antigen/teichoic acid export membrane protein